MVDFVAMGKNVLHGDIVKTKEMTENALQEKIPAQEILNDGLIPGIRKAGELFGAGQYFLPELLMAAKAMMAALDLLEPELSKADVPPAGRYMIGTVKGDLHDIGKNIVFMMLKGNGWKVTDLGVDVSPQEFCDVVAKGDIDILGLSALLTTTMPAVQETIQALQEAGLRDKVKIMVGGAPTTSEWAEKVGADAHASDASDAVSLAEKLVCN